MTLRTITTALCLGCMLLIPVAATSATPGDTTRLDAAARLIITSDAESSFVVIDGQAAGSTPLTIDSIVPGIHRLRVSSANPLSWFAKPDTATIALSPGETRELKFSVLLPFRVQPLPGNDNLAVMNGKGGMDGRTIGLWVSGSVAVVAGVIAAYNKISADDRNDAYLTTGDPSLLSQRKRFDVAAGIALAVTQVAFAALTYLLLGQ